MAVQQGPLQLKRGTSAETAAVVPAVGEPIVDLTTMSLKIGDGVTQGGVALNLVASAVKLATARSINLTGDATTSVTFDGSSNVSSALTLADTGVAAATYARVTVDSKGRVTNGAVTLPVTAGGTGSTTASAALTALGAAPLASPSFTGVPTVPTPATTDSSTTIASTAFGYNMLARFGLGTDTGALATDANAIVMSGLYRLSSTATNTPLAANATLIQMNFNTGGASQMYFPLGGAGRMFWRTQSSTTWSAWREVTGLDSPTLTGVPAAPTAAVGTNTTQLATTALVQAEIANKRSWTAYTPTVSATTGTYTTTSVTGKYMVAFGVCNVQIRLTITTKGTGMYPVISLPVAALSGSALMPLLAMEAVINAKLGTAQIQNSLTTVTVRDYSNADLVTGDGCVVTIQGSYPVA
jgi:hypothetical protein